VVWLNRVNSFPSHHGHSTADPQLCATAFFTRDSTEGGGGKWVLIGCGGCLTLVVLGVLLFAGFVWSVMGAIKRADVYQVAFERAQQSPQVQEALGTPVTTGWMFEGSIKYANGAGTAHFNVPLSGPKGEGSLVAEADKKSGEPWQYSVLEVRIEGREAIDLNATTEPP